LKKEAKTFYPLGFVTLWLAIFLAAPLAIVVAISLGQTVEGIPPYGWPDGPNLANYTLLLTDDLYIASLLHSLTVSSLTSLFCLILGYPMALAIARAPAHRRPTLLLLVILPFWTGFLLRITAWIGILRDDGWLNGLLAVLHLPKTQLLYTDTALYLGMAYCYLPFMVLPLYARLSRLDPALEQAAADLGAHPFTTFRRITWPLSLPGVLAGIVLVFIPTTGEYVIPELLGGPGSETIGRVLWTEFFGNHDWPTAAALATAFIALLLPAAAIAWDT